MRFRKKPVVIEAEQYSGSSEAIEALRLKYGMRREERDTGFGKGASAYHWVIDTLEGAMRVSLGDWIITGVKGERYPCKARRLRGNVRARPL